MALPPIQALTFENHPIRILDIDDEPWFVLADVCAVLGIANPRNVANRLDDDEKDVHSVDTLGGPQEMLIISEPGYYKIARTSRKPEAKRFDKWVTHEVLPTIRKTGSYGNSQVPAVATQIIEGLKEALRPLAIRFDGQDQAIERLDQRVGAVAEDLAAIKFRLIKGRRSISEAVKNKHIDAIRTLGGRCPCCGLSQIIGVDGLPIPKFSHFDHYYANHYPNVEHTWLICLPCHNKLSCGSMTRTEADRHFHSYQEKRCNIEPQKELF